MPLKAGQLVRNAGPHLYRMAIIIRVWQERADNVDSFPQVEVGWMYYPAQPDMVGATTQIDSRRFNYRNGASGPGYAYVIMQDELGASRPL